VVVKKEPEFRTEEVRRGRGAGSQGVGTARTEKRKRVLAKKGTEGRIAGSASPGSAASNSEEEKEGGDGKW